MPSQFETPRILHDWPLDNSNDKFVFHFNEYAITIARLIADKKTKTPFTVGISGAWGSGKTSLLKRIKGMLDETRSSQQDRKVEYPFINPHEEVENFRVCQTVWFNAWKYAEEEQLLVALIRIIVQAMFQDDFISKSAAILFEPFTPRRDVISTVLSWFSIKLNGFEFTPNMGVPQTTSLAEKSALLDLFDDVFDHLIAAWVHHQLDVRKVNPDKGILVIFIDDLDRCLPPKMIQVLEAIKLFMDKRGCVFVLGADKDIIQQAVEKVYADAGVRGQTASDYLEKVIQLRFNLPPIPDEDMNGFVKEHVTDEILRAHWRIVTMGAESNPRKVKTFLNDLMLKWSIWQNTNQEQRVDFDDFVRWEVMMRSAPAFQKRMYSLYDTKMRTKLLNNAFEWASGNEAAAASFKEDMNEQIKRVLSDIALSQYDFNEEIITSLIYMTPLEIIEEKIPVGILEKSELMDQSNSLSKRAPGGQEIFEFAGIEFVKIPRGEFIMGSRRENKLADEKYECPQTKVDISYDYWIGRFPITNSQYARFNSQFKYSPGEENYPMVNINLDKIRKYISWLNRENREELPDGCSFSLPYESEWEKAARGEFGNEWPWGNEFDKERCNCKEKGIDRPSMVGIFSQSGGDSPYGCADMAGNVWDFTFSLYESYPYDLNRDRNNLERKNGNYVIRGGCFRNSHGQVRSAFRGYQAWDKEANDIGFRLILSKISS